MAEWQDEAIILSPKPFGEGDVLLRVFSKSHGCAAGLVKAGQSNRYKALLQPGSRVKINWFGRIETQLGVFRLEPIEGLSSDILLDQGRLTALSSALAIIQNAMGENEPHPTAYDDLIALMITLESSLWGETYARWEIALLNEIGFGLDFSCCAATGEIEDLVYVSPKSGRAVSKAAGEIYKQSLLPLPEFLLKGGMANGEEIAQSLMMSAHFLTHGPFAHTNFGLPPARIRLQDYFYKRSKIKDE